MNPRRLLLCVAALSTLTFAEEAIDPDEPTATLAVIGSAEAFESTIIDSPSAWLALFIDDVPDDATALKSSAFAGISESLQLSVAVIDYHIEVVSDEYAVPRSKPKTGTWRTFLWGSKARPREAIEIEAFASLDELQTKVQKLVRGLPVVNGAVQKGERTGADEF